MAKMTWEGQTMTTLLPFSKTRARGGQAVIFMISFPNQQLNSIKISSLQII